jgi:hypothetical protein
VDTLEVEARNQEAKTLMRQERKRENRNDLFLAV